ncbi:carboxymuconolactone decarboxylase family protein [Paractinoplanes ferrugineus]|uniref:Alkyl hydroperoxide reductase AhpD n=1 Tax=Paractinoplanes ferrugineus TaxID=113564 RepID=A0A919IU42_9ACTN|nr:carboxymuconolactone decarboxylase family protein [Actinoplanes ferrugineus]GIE08234.1 alkyl hydroperoxide reductase AhpD [Actinoplanes ferrugineus]
MFIQHTLETAPAASRPILARNNHKAVGLLAESPEMLTGFLQASDLFESSTLDPLSREVVVMTIAVRNGCQVCVAMHTGRLRQIEGGPELIPALRTGDSLADPRREALRQFTLRVVETAGEVPEEEIAEFTRAGYTNRNALEVVLGIGAYTMSTLANRLVRA